MTAKTIASTISMAVLTRGHRRHLAKLLNEAGRKREPDDVLDRMEKLASDLRNGMDRLGFRPSMEDWDRSLSSRTYASHLIKKMENLSESAQRKRWIGVGKADRLLLSFCEEFAHCWRWATDLAVPRLKPEVLLLSGPGYRPALHGRARSR